MHTVRLSEDLRGLPPLRKMYVLEETVVPDLSSAALLLCPGDYHLLPGYLLRYCSVTQSCLDSLQPHGLQHTRLPCPSLRYLLEPVNCSPHFPSCPITNYSPHSSQHDLFFLFKVKFTYSEMHTT